MYRSELRNQTWEILRKALLVSPYGELVKVVGGLLWWVTSIRKELSLNSFGQALPPTNTFQPTEPLVSGDQKCGDLIRHLSSDSPTQQNSQGGESLGLKLVRSWTLHWWGLVGFVYLPNPYPKNHQRELIQAFFHNSSFRNQLEKKQRNENSMKGSSLIDWLRSWNGLQPKWHEKIQRKTPVVSNAKIWPLSSHLIKFTTSQELHQILQFFGGYQVGWKK